MELLRREVVARWLPVRPEDGHKGSFGHLLVVAGARGFTGAAKLACAAAYRSGTGLVTLAVPAGLSDVMAASLLEAMTVTVPDTDVGSFALSALEPLVSEAGARNALVIGPGISRHPETAALAREIIVRAPVPLVADADALNALAGSGPFTGAGAGPSGNARVFTPHPGEMARLTGISTGGIQANRPETALRHAAAWGVVVVLKGRGTVVAAPDGRIALCPLGNNGMGTGGTGDVLAGMLGALLAQGMEPWEAACAAVYAHARAGDLAAGRMTRRGMIAGDVIDALPDVWRELEG